MCTAGAWLIKTDSSGNMLWNRLLHPSAGGWAKSVQLTNDGGYILAGEGAPFHSAWIIKTDAEGNMLWDKTFGGGAEDGAFSVQLTSDGGYILAGKIGGVWSYVDSKPDIHMYPGDGIGSYGASGYAWLIKTDAEGNILWDKNSFINDHSGAYSVQPTIDGGYILAGMTGLGFLNYYDALLIKTDAEGNMLWNRTFGGTLFDEAYSVQPTEDGGYIVAGTTEGKAWLIKTDADGLEKTVHQESQSTDTQSLSRSGQNTPTHEEASEDTPANAKESPLPISIGAISLIAAVLSMKSSRDRL